MDQPTKIALFFVINLLLTLGSIMSLVLWSNNTYVVNYSYYTFCSIINLLGVSLGFCIYDKFGRGGNGSICISFIYTTLWIFSALGATLASRDCFATDLNCSGVIMSSIFGYLLFLIWSFAFFVLVVKGI